MECNKEEAIKAKDIAEKKMQNKDFLGAHTIALKAQKLYPDLDNISQMLVVCEVHCAAEHRICGDAMDWYSILQICPTADEATVKKQYRKLALLLHPDKNNLPGAEAAFKLIGEAQRMLTDLRLRHFFDVMYNRKKGPADVRKNISKHHQHQKPPSTQQANPKTNKTFWTICSFCFVKFQYYTDVLNKKLHCQCCSRPFIAYDISAECIPLRAKNDTNSAFPLQEPPSYGFFKKPQRANDNSSSIGDFQRKFGCRDSATQSFWKTRCPPEASVASKTGIKYVSVDLKCGGEVESDKVKQSSKLNRKWEQVRKTCDAGSRRDPDDIIIEKGDIPPRSTNESSEVKPQSAGGFQGKFRCKNSEKESFSKRPCTRKAHAVSKTCGKCESVDVKVSCEEESDKIMSTKVNGKRKDPDEIIIEKAGVILPQSTNGSSNEHYPRRSPRNKQHVSYDIQSYPKRVKRSMLPSFNEDENVDKTSEMNCVHGLSSTTEENKNDGTQGTMAFEESLSGDNIDTKETNEERAEDSVIKGCSENEDESMQVDRMKMNGSHGLAATTEENQKFGVREEMASGESLFNGNSKIESDEKELDIVVLDAPEFSNFCRGDKCFENGQIWACYGDSWDGMPRFYARIQRVCFPGFKVQISWLDPNPDDEDEIEWVNEELPVSCGKFLVRSTTDSIEDPLTFSHLVSWDQDCMSKSFNVYPKTGETWALYKDWDIKWKSGADRMTVQYEYVEVLSDYVEGLGVCVAKLGKLKGFVCLFCKLVRGAHSYFQIPSTELYRFSHQVPSCRMTGEEREDVPRGSFELDPGSLPLNLADIPVVENYEMEIEKTNFNGLCQDLPIGMGYNGGAHQIEKEDNSNVKDHSSENTQKSADANYPDAEFYDFDADRSKKQFQAGQIWALYCEEDAMPKAYCLIKKIQSHPSFQVQVEWLTADFLKDMVPWRDEKMIRSCGKFSAQGDEPQVYFMTSAFSHPVRADFKKGEYIIVPRKGEVWALYKQWNVNMTCSDMLNCEYEIVEIHEVKHTWRKVLVLERVAGFKTVFKAQVRENKPVMMEIPVHQMLRFSHLIPSFRQRKEREGSLDGFWELDPASLPVAFFKPI